MNRLLQIVASVITNRGSFLLLQIGASVITNRGSLVVTYRGKDYYKSWQVLQIGANLLQIVAGITNRGNYYKSGHNT